MVDYNYNLDKYYIKEGYYTINELNELISDIRVDNSKRMYSFQVDKDAFIGNIGDKIMCECCMCKIYGMVYLTNGKIEYIVKKLE